MLAAWVAVLFVWQLAGWTFLLPLFAGLMLATWLRAGVDRGAAHVAGVAAARAAIGMPLV